MRFQPSFTVTLTINPLSEKFDEPGVPKSPSPNGSVEVVQLAPRLLSLYGSINIMLPPEGSGNVAPLSYHTSSKIAPVG